MYYLPEIDEAPDDLAEQQQHEILVTTVLMKVMAGRARKAAKILTEKQDLLLADYDSCEIDRLIAGLEDDATGFFTLAYNEEAKPPITRHRMWRAPGG
jgi:hypothetical protein